MAEDSSQHGVGYFCLVGEGGAGPAVDCRQLEARYLLATPTLPNLESPSDGTMESTECMPRDKEKVDRPVKRTQSMRYAVCGSTNPF